MQHPIADVPADRGEPFRDSNKRIRRLDPICPANLVRL
jgi:hypothetical protein